MCKCLCPSDNQRLMLRLLIAIRQQNRSGRFNFGRLCIQMLYQSLYSSCCRNSGTVILFHNLNPYKYFSKTTSTHIYIYIIRLFLWFVNMVLCGFLTKQTATLSKCNGLNPFFRVYLARSTSCSYFSISLNHSAPAATPHCAQYSAQTSPNGNVLISSCITISSVILFLS